MVGVLGRSRRRWRATTGHLVGLRARAYRKAGLRTWVVFGYGPVESIDREKALDRFALSVH
jgi:hypothetical protein